MNIVFFSLSLKMLLKQVHVSCVFFFYGLHVAEEFPSRLIQPVLDLRIT